MARFVNLSTTYNLDPAVAELSDAAEVAFLRSVAYCGAGETHGFIPRSVLGSFLRQNRYQKRTRIVTELVSAKLWIEVEGGWQLRTWAKHNDALEQLLTRRKNDADRQRRRRSQAGEKPVDDENVSRDIERDLARGRELNIERTTPNPIQALVRRRLFGDASATTTTDDELRELWAAEAGGADLDTELRAWLIHNGGTHLADPSAALLGWLRTASKRVATVAPGCPSCLDGWVPDEFGQASAKRCTRCRPHLQAVNDG